MSIKLYCVPDAHVPAPVNVIAMLQLVPLGTKPAAVCPLQVPIAPVFAALLSAPPFTDAEEIVTSLVPVF